jgi:hypothetical protein
LIQPSGRLTAAFFIALLTDAHHGGSPAFFLSAALQLVSIWYKRMFEQSYFKQGPIDVGRNRRYFTSRSANSVDIRPS